MPPPASVERDDRIRLFCALRLPEHVLDVLVEWQHDVFARVPPSVRLVPRENLHVTLAFLGATPVQRVPEVAEALRAAAGAAGRIEFLLPARRLRETRSVGMLVLRDLHGTALALAEDLFGRLEALGIYERERRPWLPHVTVIRFRERPRIDPPLPPLGRFSPSDAAVYHSVLRSAGAQYEVLESAALADQHHWKEH